jgi:hypothetical protein
MKQIGIVTLVSVAASAAAPIAHAPGNAARFETSKTVAEFGGCFVRLEDRASRAWSYVPKEHGGTFSNIGASRARGLYYLAVSDRGAVRELRLEPASAGTAVDRGTARAVDQCV